MKNDVLHWKNAYSDYLCDKRTRKIIPSIARK